VKSALSDYANLRGAMPTLGIATVTLNVLGLALPLALLQVYDRIIPASSLGTLVVLIIGVIVAMVLENILRLARTTATAWMGARFEHMASCAAFDRLLTAPIHKVEASGTGDHLERMTAISALKDFYAEQGLGVYLDLPFVVLFLGIIALLGGWLVLVPTTILLTFCLVMYLDGRGLRSAVSEYNTVRDRRLNFVIEALGGIHTIKSMSMESQMLQRYTRLQEAVANADHQVVQRNTWALTLSNLFSQGTMIAVAAAGASLVITGQLTVGGLAACTLLAGRALQPVQRAVSMWTRLQSIRLHRERAEELFELISPSEPVQALPTNTVRGGLALKNVSFRYDDDLPNVFENISIDIRPGECVGIVGTNGCGKSTLMGLLNGSLAPTEGEVTLDGAPLSAYRSSDLKHGVIGYLPHQVSLFRGSIIENLTMFRPELRGTAMEIAHAIGLDDVVATLPQGFETPIADGAADAMPRGIRQRIAIARALTFRPRIILFDEANTAVDGPGDERLRQYLESLKGRSTLVLVTLRPSLLKLADRRFEISGTGLVQREDPGYSGGRPGGGAPAVAAPVAAAPVSALKISPSNPTEAS
jgi:ATP-binding cassette subfamily C protein LapB